VIETDGDELHKVFGVQQYRHAAHVERRLADISDPQTRNADSVLHRIHCAQCLAERFGHAIARVGQHRHVLRNFFGARIETDHVIGRRKNNAPDAREPGCFEHVPAAHDVGRQNRLPRTFDGVAAEMDYAVGACNGCLRRGHVGKVGSNERQAMRIFGRIQVRQDKPWIKRFQHRRNRAADTAGGSSKQYSAHSQFSLDCGSTAPRAAALAKLR